MTSSTLPIPAELVLPAALLDALRGGMVQLRPVVAEATEEIIDVAFEQLNPAAQHLLGLPAPPTSLLLTQAARAEAQRQQLQAIMQQAPVPISYVEGPALRLVACNAAAGEVWGRPPHAPPALPEELP